MGRKQVWEQKTPFPQVKLVRFSDKKYILLRIYDPSTQKASYRSTGTVDETKAMALVPEIYQEFLKAPHAHRKDHRVTTLQLIDRYIDHCWARHDHKEIAWNTANAKVNTFKTGLVPYVIECGLSRLSDINGTTSFKGYARWRRSNGYAQSTVTFEVKCIKEWVTWAFKAGYLKSAKCVIEVPRVAISARDTESEDGRAFTDQEAIDIGQEFERRIKAASGQQKYKLTMVFNYFNLMIDSGMRTSECYHLEFRDLMTRRTDNFLSQQVLVKVRISKTGYRETVITSMVPTIQKQLLLEHGAEVSPECRLWLNPRTGKPYSISAIRETFRDVLKALGLEDNHRLYDARATYITERLLNGGHQLSTYLLAKAVGNSESQIRATYENILMRQAAERLVQRTSDESSAPEFESMV